MERLVYSDRRQDLILLGFAGCSMSRFWDMGSTDLPITSRLNFFAGFMQNRLTAWRIRKVGADEDKGGELAAAHAAIAGSQVGWIFSIIDAK